MTDTSIFEAFEKKMVELIEFANKEYKIQLPVPKLEFVRMGTVAGRASYMRQRIMINPDFFGKHYEFESLSATSFHLT